MKDDISGYPEDGFALGDATPAVPITKIDYIGLAGLAFRNIDEKTPDQKGIPFVPILRNYIESLPEEDPRKNNLGPIIQALPDSGVAELLGVALKSTGLDVQEILQDGVITGEEFADFLTKHGKQALENGKVLKADIMPEDRLAARQLISDFGIVSDDTTVDNLAAANRNINASIPPELIEMMLGQFNQKDPILEMPQPYLDLGRPVKPIAPI